MREDNDMYDLKTVLTTIAACSASIVAILGGFIASKLIAINAERDEVNTRISELDWFYWVSPDHLMILRPKNL